MAVVSDTIVSPAVERDIIALARIEKHALMRRLMDLAVHYSGQIQSYNKMLGQLQEAGNATTLAEYLDLLSEARLVAGLPKYSGARYVVRGSSPKLNVLNTTLLGVFPTRCTNTQVAALHALLWAALLHAPGTRLAERVRRRIAARNMGRLGHPRTSSPCSRRSPAGTTPGGGSGPATRRRPRA